MSEKLQRESVLSCVDQFGLRFRDRLQTGRRGGPNSLETVWIPRGWKLNGGERGLGDRGGGRPVWRQARAFGISKGGSNPG